jgi:hypothetical protein
VIYLYAITEAAPQGFSGLGVDGEPVVTLACSELHLTHSFHRPDFKLEVTPDALWAHEGVVDELMAIAPVLPFRFGTTLPDRERAEAFVAREACRFKRTLSGLRGRVELAVRVALPERQDSAPSDGATYLRARAREREVLTSLDRLAAANTKKKSSGRTLSASYLVAEGDIDRFASLVRELQESNPDVALTCTGPWAPYSFVGERS